MSGTPWGARLIVVGSDRWEEFLVPSKWVVHKIEIRDGKAYILFAGPLSPPQ